MQSPRQDLEPSAEILYSEPEEHIGVPDNQGVRDEHGRHDDHADIHRALCSSLDDLNPDANTLSECAFPARWLPFDRDDLPLSMYERLKILIGFFTLIPVRLVLVILTSFVYASMTFLLHAICAECTARNRLLRRMGALFARIILFWLGFYHLEVSGNRPATIDAYPPVIVANHVSWLDILVLVALCDFPSFTAKEAIQRVPIIGRLCTLNHAVYVNSKQHPEIDQVMGHGKFATETQSALVVEPPRNRSASITTTISHHLQDAAHGRVPPLAIFPEGTTTNGKFLLYFHRGAFVAGEPCLPVAFRYPCSHFSLAWESFFFVPHVLQTAAQFYNRVQVHFCPVHTVSADEANDPALYAENVRRDLQNVLQVPLSSATYADKMAFHKSVFERHYLDTSSTFLQPIFKFWLNPNFRLH